jgi:adenylate cyclase
MINRTRILIVDDEPLNIDLLEQELDQLGYETISAGDGQAALDTLASEAVDLVILDVMMPRLDGYDVLQRLKSDPKLHHLPILMVSALNELASVVRCIELGAEDYLPKPFDPVLLRARIGACLEKKRLHDRELFYLKEIERQLEVIERERERADRLLHAILPAPAVAELKKSDRIEPRRYSDVMVLFADIVDFTPYCEAHRPEEVVANLDRLANICEGLIAAHGLEKIKTVGDGLLATGNLLQPLDDAVMAGVRCAFAIAEAAADSPLQWQMRIGIHVGPVVAGVIGRNKFSFDLWGDTVNVAARLSAVGSAGAVLASGEAWSHLQGRCRGLLLGPVGLKGRGQITVYRCEGVDDNGPVNETRHG